MGEKSHSIHEMDDKVLFDLLESSNRDVVQEIQSIISNFFHDQKESCLVNGLYDYYLQTGSAKCSEILCGITREPHDKFLIDRMHEGIRSSNREAKKRSLVLLGQLACKQPSWLYKITQSNLLFKELTKVLKTENDVTILTSGILAIIMIMPIIPIYIVHYINDIFDVFGRVATWTSSSRHIHADHLIHLQVALYSLFHRLYGMYPCNFLSYLRHTFSGPDKRTVFSHTIMPMLEKVKMHPSLVIGTKEGETMTSRWKSKEYHDVIIECSKISLDIFESGFPETAAVMSHSDSYKDPPSPSESQESQVFKLPKSDWISQTFTTEFNNLSTFVEESAPPTPLSIHLETAMEATPENTPIKENRSNSLKNHPMNPSVAVQLFPASTSNMTRQNAPFNLPNEKSFPTTPPATPYTPSVPSSPGPTQAEFRRDSIFDSVHRRESILLQRLQKVLLEQQQGALNASSHAEENSRILKRAAPAPLSIPHEEDYNLSCSSGPLTPATVLPIGAVESDYEEDNHSSCESNCNSGGLHMADNQAMIAFAKRVSRLRFHSQCTPGVDSETVMINVKTPKLTRSRSCPGIKEALEANKNSSDSETTPCTGVEERQKSDLVKPVFKIEQEDPIGLLFNKILPQIFPPRGRKSASLPSPYILLDAAVKKAATLQSKLKPLNEAAFLRGQLELLHFQLLFERHRREAHALRNRRLAGKLKKLFTMEETVNILKKDVKILKDELETVKSKLNEQRSINAQLENDNRAALQDLQRKLESNQLRIIRYKDKQQEWEAKYSKLYEEHITLLKECDDKYGDIANLQNIVQHSQKYMTKNQQLKTAYEKCQKDLILLGECFRRYQEKFQYGMLHSSSEQSQEFITSNANAAGNGCPDKITYLKLAYEEEIREIKSELERKCSDYEAANGYINDMRNELIKVKKSAEDHKKIYENECSETKQSLKAAEDKYETLKSINQRLDLEILNLQHQIRINRTTNSRGQAPRPQARSSSSTNGELTPSSDVDSAASASGLYQTSPDPNICIFGSPQFDMPTEEIPNLQYVLEQQNQVQPPDQEDETAASSQNGDNYNRREI